MGSSQFCKNCGKEIIELSSLDKSSGLCVDCSEVCPSNTQDYFRKSEFESDDRYAIRINSTDCFICGSIEITEFDATSESFLAHMKIDEQLCSEFKNIEMYKGIWLLEDISPLTGIKVAVGKAYALRCKAHVYNGHVYLLHPVSEGYCLYPKSIPSGNGYLFATLPTGATIHDIFNGLIFIQRNGKYGWINFACQEVAPCIYDEICVSSKIINVRLNRKWGIVDAVSGKEITAFKYDEIHWSNSHHVGVRIGDKWAFINVASGKEITAFKYDEIEHSDHGLIGVYVKDKWGFIDASGKEIVPCKYPSIHYLSNGLVQVCFNEKIGFLDIYTSNEIISCKYNNVGELPEFDDSDEQVIISVQRNDKWGFIDVSGKEVISFIYDDAYSSFYGQAIVSQNNKFGIIDIYGNQIVACKYEWILQLTGEFTAVQLNDKWGFVNKSGQEITPCIYDEIYDGFYLDEEFVGVNLDDKWGAIDIAGAEIIPCNYDEIHFHDSFRHFPVVLEGKTGVLDKSGKEIAPCIYDAVSIPASDFMAVELNGKWGIIGEFGQEITPCVYEDVKIYSEIICVKSDGKWGFIDTFGHEITSCKYDKLVYEMTSLFAVINQEVHFIIKK